MEARSRMGRRLVRRHLGPFSLWTWGSYAQVEFAVRLPKGLHLSIFYRSARALVEVELWSAWFMGKARSHKVKFLPRLRAWYAEPLP